MGVSVTQEWVSLSDSVPDVVVEGVIVPCVISSFPGVCVELFGSPVVIEVFRGRGNGSVVE